MTNYFNKSELVCRCSGKHCDQSEVISDRLLEKLNRCREKCGFPFRVNSAFRCVDWNEEKGGFPNSYHTQGLAIDIAALDGRMKHKIIAAAVEEGLSFGVYSNFIHLDLRPGACVAFRGGY